MLKLGLKRNPFNEEIRVIHLTAQLQFAEVDEGTPHAQESLRWWSLR